MVFFQVSTQYVTSQTLDVWRSWN